MRLFSTDTKETRYKEFLTVNKLAERSKFISNAIEFNDLKGTDLSYMILDYLPVKDGEEALLHMTKNDQYEAGFQAGIELHKLHSLSAPTYIQPWYDRKKQKVNQYLFKLQQVPIAPQIKDMLSIYIQQNED